MNVEDRFSDEEKKHLSYLDSMDSMLPRLNTPLEEEVQRLLDAGEVQAESDAPAQQQQRVENEESAGN